MAQRVIIKVIDDLDGKELRNGRGETVLFSLDGTSYEIDLSAKNAKAFRSAMQRYVDVARRTPGTARPRPGKGTARSNGTTRTIREWARANGYAVTDRGRIPADVVRAYDAAH